MAIKRDVKVVIANDISRVEEMIYVFQHDRGIDLYFDIIENKFSFTGTQSESIIARSEDIMYAGLTVKKPSGEGFFRPVLPIQENRVLFHLEHSHTDDFNEIGTYELQIHLYDKFDNRVSIPPFSLEVKPLVVDNIAEIGSSKDAVVDYAVVDKSVVAKDEKVLFTIEHNGDTPYIKTVWKAGDIITEAKINNMEQGIENVSKALENLEIPSVEGLATEEYVNEQISNIDMSEFAKTDDVDSKIEEVQAKIDEIEIPSIEGLASEDFVTEKITEATDGLASENYVDEKIADIDFPETDLSNYPTRDEVSSEINSAKEELNEAISDIEIPSIDGLATEEYVDEAIRTIELTPGADGKDGQDGKDGKSAYEIAVENGFEGNEEAWLASLKGEQGIQGIQGEQGVSGRDGVDGIDGIDGIDGKSVELQKSATHIQWKQTNGTWQNLIALEDLKGDKGEQGDGSTVDFSNYYTKAEADKAILDALENVNVDLSDYATLEFVREQIANVTVDLSDYYTKSQVNQLIEDNKFDPTGLATEEFVNEKIEGIDIPDISPLATKEELEAKADELEAMIPDIDIDNFYEKVEIDAMLSKMDGLFVNGTIGVNGRTAKHLIPNSLKVEISDFEGDYPEVKHELVLYNKSEFSTTPYRKYFFFCDLDNPILTGKYISHNDKRNINFNGMTAGVDYVTACCNSLTTPPTGLSKSATGNTSFSHTTDCVYDFNFNLYDTTGSKVLIPNTYVGGDIGDFDDAKEGFYTINIKAEDVNDIRNAPKLKSDAIGYLETVGKTQTYYNYDGDVFTREIGGIWTNTSEGAISKEPVAKIGASQGIATPTLFKTRPGLLKRFAYSETYAKPKVVMFRRNENEYVVLTTISINNASHRLDGASLYIGKSLETQYDTYNATTNTWTTKEQVGTSTISDASISVNLSYFTVYHTDIPIYRYGTSNIIYDITQANYDIEETISNYDNATTTGHYEIDVEADMTIENAPIDGELKGMLEVVNSNGFITQKVTTVSGDIFTRIFNESWTEWKSEGSVDIDLSHLATKEELEEAIEGIDIPEVDLSNYPTKSEVTSEIEEAMKNIDVSDIEVDLSDVVKKEFVGLVGMPPVTGDMPEEIYGDVPEPPIVENCEYIGKAVYKYINPSSKVIYRVDYIYNNIKDKVYPYHYVRKHNNSAYGDYIYLTNNKLGGKYNTLYGYIKEEGATSWTSSTAMLSDTLHIEFPTTEIYHWDLPIYSDVDKTGIYRQGALAYITNFDDCTEYGDYVLEVSKDRYKLLENAPNIDVQKDVKAILTVRKQDALILQEVTIEDITFTRVLGEEWSSLNLDDFIKSDSINDIKGESTVAYGIVEDIFAECPIPSTHNKIIGYMDFTTGTSSSTHYYQRIYLVEGSGSDAFCYQIYNDTTGYIGYSGAINQCYLYEYKKGSWTRTLSGSSNIRTYTSYCRVYKNTLPICDYNNKDIVYKEADVDVEIVDNSLKDFNLATQTGHYNVSIEANTTASNAPSKGELSGILKVVNANSLIEQVLESTNGKTFKRMFNKTWSEWQEIGANEVDIDDYYTKTEINDKTDFLELSIEEINDDISKINTNISDINSDISDINNTISDFKIPFPDQLKTVTYKNSEGGTEYYKYFDMNGLKFMWIDYTFTEAEYTGASSGMFYKTFNIPTEAQIFNTIMFASQVSYARSTNNYLSRIMQNSEIASNTIVRARYRHDELTKPYIDRVTMMVIGF